MFEKTFWSVQTSFGGWRETAVSAVLGGAAATKQATLRWLPTHKNQVVLQYAKVQKMRESDRITQLQLALVGLRRSLDEQNQNRAIWNRFCLFRFCVSQLISIDEFSIKKSTHVNKTTVWYDKALSVVDHQSRLSTLWCQNPDWYLQSILKVTIQNEESWLQGESLGELNVSHELHIVLLSLQYSSFSNVSIFLTCIQSSPST